MKILMLSILFVSLFVIPSISSVSSVQNIIIQQNAVPDDTYAVRVCIDGKWYIITYSSNGYIVNIVVDDE